MGINQKNINIKSILGAHLEYVLILFLVFTLVNYLTNDTFWNFIGKGAGLLGIAILIFYIYKDKKKRIQRKEYTVFFSDEIEKLLFSIQDSIDHLVIGYEAISERLKEHISSRHLKTFLNNQRTSTEQEYEIITDCFDFIKKEFSLSEAEKLLLQYIFLKNKKETLIERFKRNLPSDGNLRNEFDLLLTAKEKNPTGDISQLREKVKEITKEELKNQKAKWDQREALYLQLQESLNKKDIAMNSIITVGKKLFSESNIRESNLLSVSKMQKNIIAINCKEVPLPKTIKKYQTKSPLSKIIEEKGFIKAFSKGDLYLKKDISFNDEETFKSHIESIKQGVEKNILYLKKTPEGQKLKGVMEGGRYKFIVSRLSEHDLYIYHKGYPFTEEFNDKFLINLQPNEAIALIAEHPHKVKDVLSRIDLDNLASGYPDEIQKLLFRRRRKIKNAIKKSTGFEIGNITEFRHLKKNREEIIQLIHKIILDEQLSFNFSLDQTDELVDRMIKIAEEYYFLLNKLNLT